MSEKVYATEESIDSVVAAVADLTAAKGYPPTVAEITDVMPWVSKSTTQQFVNLAVRRGLLTKDPLVARSIRVTS